MKTEEYYLSRMTYVVEVKQGKDKLDLQGEILQLVKAENKEAARKKVNDNFLKEKPKGIILEIRIFDTII